mmetsp:Transcript_80566/g.215076  ORF Transcript_80566/g.215076 Transcript_80566/m.215076 type:complete len:285 (+) Transcript_80566:421-1275(+)
MAQLLTSSPKHRRAKLLPLPCRRWTPPRSSAHPGVRRGDPPSTRGPRAGGGTGQGVHGTQAPGTVAARRHPSSAWSLDRATPRTMGWLRRRARRGWPSRYRRWDQLGTRMTGHSAPPVGPGRGRCRPGRSGVRSPTASSSLRLGLPTARSAALSPTPSRTRPLPTRRDRLRARPCRQAVRRGPGRAWRLRTSTGKAPSRQRSWRVRSLQRPQPLPGRRGGACAGRAAVESRGDAHRPAPSRRPPSESRTRTRRTSEVACFPHRVMMRSWYAFFLSWVLVFAQRL